MFDDPKKELEALEQKMLAAEQDDWLDQQLAEAHALLGDAPVNSGDVRNYANGYGQPQYEGRYAQQAAPQYVPKYGQQQNPYQQPVQTAPRYVPQGAPQESGMEEEEPGKKKVDFLNILIILELLGIAGFAGYWTVMLL